MTKLLLSLLVLGAAWSAAPVLVEDDGEADRVAIRAHIDCIFRAYIEKDRATVRATHSEDWVGYLSYSHTMIKGIEGYMAYAEGALGAPTGITDYEMVEIEIQLHDDMALVPYTARMDVTLPGGFEIQPMIRVLDVYAKREGEWIQIGSNVARHPETEDEYRQLPMPVHAGLRTQILTAREKVWRAWFENDAELLAQLVPEETVAMGSSGGPWQDQGQILEASAWFAEQHGKLIELAFPETEIQLYGDVAILYTTYRTVVEMNGERQEEAGRGTEVFVRRDGVWVNSGWHLESED